MLLPGISQLTSALTKPRRFRADLLRSAGGVLAINTVSICLSLANVILLARLLGPHGYGIYSFVLAVVSLVAVPASLGLPQLLTREIASYRVRHRWGHLKGLLRRALQFAFATSSLVSLAVYAIAVSFWASEYHTAMSVAIPIIPFFTLNAIILAALYGLRHPVLARLPERLMRPALLAAFALTAHLFLGNSAIRPETVVALNLGSTTICFIVGYALLLSRTPSQTSRARPRFRSRIWLVGAMPFMLISGMQMVMAKTDLIMLGAMREPGDVGIYRGVVQLVALVAMPLQVSNMVVGPVFSGLAAKANYLEIQRIATLTARSIFACALPLTAVLWLFGGGIIRLTLGQDFLIGTAALTALCAGQLINSGVGSVGSLLSMTGHEYQAFFAIALATAVNIVANCIFIPRWGITGAALATALGLSLSNAFMATVAWRRLRIDPTPLGLRLPNMANT